MRHTAALLRAHLVVRAHDAGEGSPARRERRGATGTPTTSSSGRYGNWLENNVDWALSRERYWGTPLPIWRCEPGHVRAVGSLTELGELAGRDVTDVDPHRPTIDDVTFACPECGEDATPRSRGDRRLVRLGRDAVRAVGIPPRPRAGHRGVRAALPGRLHLRGDRPDPRLVLHADGRGRAAFRRDRLPQRRVPRTHRRRRRPEDVEVARQHVRPVGGAGPPGRRRPALVHDHERLAVGLAPHRPRGARRRAAAVPADAAQRPRVLRDLRERRRVRPGVARAPARRATPARPVGAVPARAHGRAPPATGSMPTTPPARAAASSGSSTTSRTGTCAARAAGSGTRAARRPTTRRRRSTRSTSASSPSRRCSRRSRRSSPTSCGATSRPDRDGPARVRAPRRLSRGRRGRDRRRARRGHGGRARRSSSLGRRCARRRRPGCASPCRRRSCTCPAATTASSRCSTSSPRS